MDIIGTIKKYPVPILGGVIILVFISSRGSKSGGVSDAVTIASINAQKDIAIKQLDTKSDIKQSQSNLIVERIKSQNQTKLGLAITGNDRVVDLSKIKGDVTIQKGNQKVTNKANQLEFNLGSLLGKLEAGTQNNKIAAEREIAFGSQKVQKYGIDSALDLGKADLNNRTQLATIASNLQKYVTDTGAQLQREQWAWDAPQRWHEADVQAENNRLNLFGHLDDNATNVTLMKKQMNAQNLQAGLDLTGRIVESSNETWGGMVDSFFGMFGGGGGKSGGGGGGLMSMFGG